VNKLTACSALLFLATHAVATAGALGWAPVGPYPSKSNCQPVSFDQPDAVAVDKSGDIYIGNESGPAALQEVTASTIRTILDRRMEPIKSGHYFGLSLAMSPGGSLFLAVRQRGTVEKLNPNGTTTVFTGKPGDRRLLDGDRINARLRSPGAIAIGPDGVIYVADTRTIRKIVPNGSITTLAGDPHARNPHQCYRGCPYAVNGRGAHAVFMSPNGIAVSPSGDIYVADGYNGDVEGQAASLGVIRKVTPGGDVSTLAGTVSTTGGDIDGQGANASFDYVSGIAVASLSNIYVTEPFAASVRRINPDGRVSTVVSVSAPGYLSTNINAPTGIAVTSLGSLVVVDDIAVQGLESLTERHVYWLHRIKAGKLQTLCRE